MLVGVVGQLLLPLLIRRRQLALVRVTQLLQIVGVTPLGGLGVGGVARAQAGHLVGVQLILLLQRGVLIGLQLLHLGAVIAALTISPYTASGTDSISSVVVSRTYR